MQTDPFPDSFDRDHVLSKYPYLNTLTGRELARRIARANVKRRQFIRYCRDHTLHLGNTGTQANDGLTKIVSSKATTLPPAMDFNTLGTEEVDDDAESLMTASTTFDTHTKLRLPSLSSLSPEGEAFQCPVCSTLQQFEKDKAWRMHAYRDLRAYSCTIGGKECGSKMFEDRKSWFEHEIAEHRSYTTCTLCNKQLPGKDAAMRHIKASHGILLSEQLSALAVSGHTTPNRFKASDCPFCDWPLERRRRRVPTTSIYSGKIQDDAVSRAELKRHIAIHQEQLALFVLPLSDASVIEDTDSEGRDDREGDPSNALLGVEMPDEPDSLVRETNSYSPPPITDEGSHDYEPDYVTIGKRHRKPEHRTDDHHNTQDADDLPPQVNPSGQQRGRSMTGDVDGGDTGLESARRELERQLELARRQDDLERAQRELKELKLKAKIDAGEWRRHKSTKEEKELQAAKEELEEIRRTRRREDQEHRIKQKLELERLKEEEEALAERKRRDKVTRKSDEPGGS
ncbi:uncharacterized protein PG986_011265 [Apiospora aurea]|uniref:C2H2-type domain-containing protein n=1 Tax=Apiospora aurea TaxID=335848 RepID=A0ABR1Q5A8_9PEZI